MQEIDFWMDQIMSYYDLVKHASGTFDMIRMRTGERARDLHSQDPEETISFHLYAYVHVCVCMHVCMCVCMRICICV